MIWVPIAYLLMSTISPGPVTVLTVHNSTRYGRLAGVAVALGGVATTAIFVLLALIFTHKEFFQLPMHIVHRYQQMGAVLLLVMGLLAGYKSLKTQLVDYSSRTMPKHYAQSFLKGMALMAPFFPQAILFYTVILSHNVNSVQLNQAILTMGALKVVLTLVWYTLLATTASKIRALFFRPKIQRVFGMAVAAFLIGTSLNMLF